MKKYIKYIALIVTLFVIFSVIRTTIGLLGKGGALEEARNEVALLEKEQAELLELREKVESDEFVEKEARNRLGLAKNGEKIVVLPPKDVLARLAPPSEEKEFLEELPIWKRWVRLFFGMLPNF